MILNSTNTRAQSGGSIGFSDAKGIGLAFTQNAMSEGLYSINKNPANLSFMRNHSHELITLLPLPGLSLTFGNEFLSLNDYYYFFTGSVGSAGSAPGNYLDSENKEKFRSLFENGNKIHSGFTLNLFSFAYSIGSKKGVLGLSIYDYSFSRATVPLNLINLVLDGNQPGTNYEFNDAELKSWYLRNYALSYSIQTESILPGIFSMVSLGITAKLIHGMWYSSLDYFDTELLTKENLDIAVKGNHLFRIVSSSDFGINFDFEEETKESNFGPFPSPAGTGWGIDLGVSGIIDDKWKVSLSLTDIGQINWSDQSVVYKSSSDYILKDVTEKDFTDSLSLVLKGKGSYDDSFSTSLPLTLRIGMVVDINKLSKISVPGQLRIGFDYNQGLNNSPSNSLNPRFSIGAEWTQFEWFILRAGISAGGFYGLNWGLGVGFDTGLLEFDIGTSDLHNIFRGNDLKEF